MFYEFLDGSKESFEATVWELEKFALFSGLNINFEKTAAIWIGINRGCLTRYMTQLKIQWNPETFTVLGITFSLDLEAVININYQKNFTKMHRIMMEWKARDLTPIGRNAVFKSLILSLFTHLFITLPCPGKNILKKISQSAFEFIWKKKIHKIKKTTVIRKYSEGGLKLTWIRKICTSNAGWKCLLNSIHPQILNFQQYGGYFLENITETNVFWKDLFAILSDFCIRFTPLSLTEFLHEPLFFNTFLSKNDTQKAVEKWLNCNIMKIGDLLDNNGIYMKFEIFQQIHGKNINFLEYYSRILAIVKYKRKIGHLWKQSDRNTTGYAPLLAITKHKKDTKGINNKLLCSQTPPTCIRKWEKVFPDLQWGQIFDQYLLLQWIQNFSGFNIVFCIVF
ncbi:uncharacterized protein LOC112567428 isoform X1 [Pomacea canaliculata]|uniref:uncharacterized protein LOC112567428 isoform X1 n=1 Tax=Pomacea canaliculata TaxID=400727 RepID=UPI000D725493|nr:uncharacterized protein LOC112567428 isoform X1 [Pomacea canaliculata]